VQLWQQDKEQWTREEALANIAVAEFVELPEMKVIESHRSDDESFGKRALRQLSDAQVRLNNPRLYFVLLKHILFDQDFPQYLINFIKRFATGSYASVSSSAASTSANDSPSRDAFGFRQVIVAATPVGKVYGIDSSNGNILWSRVLGLGWAGEVGGKVIPVKLFVTRTVSDGETPQVVLVTQRRAENVCASYILILT